MIKIDDNSFPEIINRVAATEDGRALLFWIKHYCNWDSTLMANDMAMTQHHASIRGVWGRLRQSIDKKYLKEIEHDYTINQSVKAKKAGK